MKLKNLHEDLPQPKKQKTKVWQPEEAQGKKKKRWYAPSTAGPEAKTYRWGDGKPMSGDGYEDHIMPVGQSSQKSVG